MSVFCPEVRYYLSLVDDESLGKCTLEYLRNLYYMVKKEKVEENLNKEEVIKLLREACVVKEIAQTKSIEEIEETINLIITRSQGISKITHLLQEHIGVAETSDLTTISEIGLTDKLEVRDDEQGNFEKDVYLMDTASDLKKRVRHHSSLEGPPSKKMTRVKLLSYEAKKGLASFFSALTSNMIEKEFEKDTKILELEKKITSLDNEISSLKNQVISLTNTSLEIIK